MRDPNITQAIRDLKACGLARNQFRVRTIARRVHDHGISYQEYHGITITTFAKLERMIELAPKLAEHFQVELMKTDGEIKYVFVDFAYGRPSLTERVVF